MKTKNLYIMSAGKSTRFNSKPKILETYNMNKRIFNKYFDNVFIVTNKEIYNKINVLDANFIVMDLGYGSGYDVATLLNKQKQIYVCWSDVFFSEDNIIDILKYRDTPEQNIMCITYKTNPYINIVTQDDIIVEYLYNSEKGYQDTSIFYINDIKYAEKEFMDLCIKNNFKCMKTYNDTLFFNTKEELDNIKDKYEYLYIKNKNT